MHGKFVATLLQKFFIWVKATVFLHGSFIATAFFQNIRGVFSSRTFFSIFASILCFYFLYFYFIFHFFIIRTDPRWPQESIREGVLVDFCDSLLDFISFYLVPYILDFVHSAIASYREQPFLFSLFGDELGGADPASRARCLPPPREDIGLFLNPQPTQHN